MVEFKDLNRFHFILIGLYAVLFLLLVATQYMIASQSAKIEEVRRINEETWALT
jgi:hypothetical protein